MLLLLILFTGNKASLAIRHEINWSLEMCYCSVPWLEIKSIAWGKAQNIKPHYFLDSPSPIYCHSIPPSFLLSFLGLRYAFWVQKTNAAPIPEYNFCPSLFRPFVSSSLHRSIQPFHLSARQLGRPSVLSYIYLLNCSSILRVNFVSVCTFGTPIMIECLEHVEGQGFRWPLLSLHRLSVFIFSEWARRSQLLFEILEIDLSHLVEELQSREPVKDNVDHRAIRDGRHGRGSRYQMVGNR